MVGYPESLTDPSYEGQILIPTYPLIGNYGAPDYEAMEKYGEAMLHKFVESDRIHAAGFVVSHYSPFFSHFQAKCSLSAWLQREKIPALYGVDSRYLTKVIRDQGCLLGKIMFTGGTYEDLKSNHSKIISMFQDIQYFDPNSLDLVERVSCKLPKVYTPLAFNDTKDPTVVVLDVGAKANQIRCLLKRGVRVKVIPWNSDLVNEVHASDGLFISNGPGDPSKCVTVIESLRKVLQTAQVPIFGICLGHQLLALASGAHTLKLAFGNRGHNIPCRDLRTKRCYVTSQNHGFAVDVQSLPDDWEPMFVNMNDGSNEGIMHKSKPFMSVQFHPEACAGPQDTEFLFDEFVSAVKNKIKSLGIFRKSLSSIEPASYHIRPVKKCLVLGSGGLSIGQAGEFDYSGSQAIKSLKEEGITVVLINPNIATIQTSEGLADKVYFLPVQPQFVRQVIEIEKPDSILVTFGGQTALNVGVQMRNEFQNLGVQVLGTSIETIMATEDRDIFGKKLEEISERMAVSKTAETMEEAFEAALSIGFPVIVRAAYALGGLGSGFAQTPEELAVLCTKAFSVSPQVLVEKSMKGWKEIEYEVVRDAFDNCITVCNMENVDPLGIHTGDSIVVAPSQTLSDRDYQMLRNTAIKVIRHLGVIGECNIQYALNPITGEYCIIEVNARLSRSSALASKATGYPLAFVAAKLALGKRLDEINNVITRKTVACFEPSLDYVVVKIPRWDLKKFSRVNSKISSAMKSVGEIMAIGRNFEEAIQKGIRSLDLGIEGFVCTSDCPFTEVSKNDLSAALENPQYDRLFTIANSFWAGMTVEEVHDLTKIDPWFLSSLYRIYSFDMQLQTVDHANKDRILDGACLSKAKMLGFSDKHLAKVLRLSSELVIRNLRKEFGVTPLVRQIDTVAGEFPCYTNYLYRTYGASFADIDCAESCMPNSAKVAKPAPILVLGSGVYKIGSSVEFDWCCVRSVRTLKSLGYSTIMMNYNPETVSTDFDEVDKLYFENMSIETVLDVYEHENPKGVVVSMGGQIPNNLALSLSRQGVSILGTSAQSIDQAENRYKFSRLLDQLGVDQPKWKELSCLEAAHQFCESVKYPVLVRPSYVLSGAAMRVIHSEHELSGYLQIAAQVSKDHPVVISKFIEGAKEIEMDAVALDGVIKAQVISEHVENAGVHSGDATLVLPPQDLDTDTIDKIKLATAKIAKSLNVSGPMNIQFIAKDSEIKVIECNLRASRSFPFISKVLDFDMIELATKCLINQVDGNSLPKDTDIFKNDGRIAVKVPQFSFSRLEGADPILGVEMASTGEVACFGSTKYDAYLKALIATSFVIPKSGSNILLSIGSFREKLEFLPSATKLTSLGFKLFATAGTADFLQEHNIDVTVLDAYELSPGIEEFDLEKHLSTKKISLYINLPSKNHYRRPATFLSRGYRTRRMAVDLAIPLITNIKCAKLLVEAIYQAEASPRFLKVVPSIDSKHYDVTMCAFGGLSGVTEPLNNFFGRSLIMSVDITRDMLKLLFHFADLFQTMPAIESLHFLRDKIVCLAFLEPSTRTSSSFEAAVYRLGGKVLKYNEASSSSKKGESFQDTIRTLAGYADLMVIRHSTPGINAQLSPLVSPLPIINAGDGDGEHPTQALLDLYTIRREIGTVNGLSIAFVGDLKHSRTVHSALQLLSLYKNLTIFLLPVPGLEPDLGWLTSLFNGASGSTVSIHGALDEVLPLVDVVYMTRIQSERATSPDCLQYPDRLKLTSSALTIAKEKMIVMHPLPRLNEISSEVDMDPRAAYFRQAKYGVVVRMALLYLTLTRKPQL